LRSGLGQAGSWNSVYPGRPEYFTHWGEAYKLAASVIGLPIGDYPYSRPPQGRLPEEAREQIRAAYEASGMGGKARVPAAASAG
jgi:4-hydroxy-tetrahydrodipicolinate synthase